MGYVTIINGFNALENNKIQLNDKGLFIELTIFN